jgi:hypothetical protein
MQDEKWQDPSTRVLNLKYLLLSLSATILIVLGVIGHLLPDLLSMLGNNIKNTTEEYWFVFVGLGVTIGTINAFTAFSANKHVKPTQ